MKRNKVRCVNNHYFDGNQFDRCPLCGAERMVPAAGMPAGGPLTVKVDTEGLERELARSDREIGRMEPPVRTDNLPKEEPREPAPEPEPPHVRGPEFSPEPPAKEPEAPKKLQESAPDAPPPQRPIASPKPEIFSKPVDEVKEPAVNPAPNQERSASRDLEESVRKTHSTTASVLPKTVAYYDSDSEEPPVGWLVCVRGVYQGKAFVCRTGRNFIGRDASMDIILDKDISIARDRHAIIAFEPQKRKFHIEQYNNRNIIYLDGEELYGNAEIQAYQHITMGSCEYVFLPLCGEKFTWDDYLK